MITETTTEDTTTDADRPPWTWGTAVRLELRGVCWTIGATLPVATLVNTVLTQHPDYILVMFDWLPFIVVVAIPFVVIGAAAILPLTYLLGHVLERVRPWPVHIVAQSILGGTLAAVPLAFGPDVFPAEIFGSAPFAVGAAAALARYGQLRRATRTPADPLPDATT
ncbi:hypothetical protein [Curtobacterium sp. Leaf261]|uniref:hypothetical protein n=1 Tax=Curtobacterium sp. Leaf261 TaxID=1736311 RepID=UPI0006F748E9|nr:hypothetical protein [Curtobacterium sp. Leaf261]KQO62936.1 hypothetical protein ASF23_08505 [Curtobacterium sp. Leaf261]